MRRVPLHAVRRHARKEEGAGRIFAVTGVRLSVKVTAHPVQHHIVDDLVRVSSALDHPDYMNHAFPCPIGFSPYGTSQHDTKKRI